MTGPGIAPDGHTYMRGPLGMHGGGHGWIMAGPLTSHWKRHACGVVWCGAMERQWCDGGSAGQQQSMTSSMTGAVMLVTSGVTLVLAPAHRAHMRRWCCNWTDSGWASDRRVLASAYVEASNANQSLKLL